MLPEKIIYITVIISLIGYLVMFKDIFKGTTKPNLVSWFLWMLGPFIGTFFQLKAGAGLSVLPVFMAGFGPLIVIVFSILKRNSIWKITRLDIFCGILALLALVFYVFTHNLEISILFAILSDGFAAIPTLVKSWNFPETETAAVYWPGVLNNILGLLIIQNWIFSIYSFSIYLILMNLAIVLCIYRKKILNMLYFRNGQ
jgi:hypothetical protein